MQQKGSAPKAKKVNVRALNILDSSSQNPISQRAQLIDNSTSSKTQLEAEALLSSQLENLLNYTKLQASGYKNAYQMPLSGYALLPQARPHLNMSSMNMDKKPELSLISKKVDTLRNTVNYTDTRKSDNFSIKERISVK